MGRWSGRCGELEIERERFWRWSISIRSMYRVVYKDSNLNLRRRGTDDATLNSSIAAQADWEFCHWM